MSEQLLVFLGDVEDSRRIEGRDEFQRLLEATCDQLNRDHQAHLRAEFAILKGIDEIGAALLSVSPVYEMIDAVGRALYPQRMRFALARGEVDTGLQNADVGRMDGPAFHEAAAIMAELKANRLPVGLAVGDSAFDDALSGAASLIQMAKARRSERQWEAVREYERLGTQALAGVKLQVSQQAISHALVSSDYRQVRLVEERLNRAFGDYARRIAEAEGRDE
ncbi:MAG: SatD family protein [Candidatus Eisenbacteria bacterium]